MAIIKKALSTFGHDESTCLFVIYDEADSFQADSETEYEISEIQLDNTSGGVTVTASVQYSGGSSVLVSIPGQIDSVSFSVDKPKTNDLGYSETYGS